MSKSRKLWISGNLQNCNFYSFKLECTSLCHHGWMPFPSSLFYLVRPVPENGNYSVLGGIKVLFLDGFVTWIGDGCDFQSWKCHVAVMCLEKHFKSWSFLNFVMIFSHKTESYVYPQCFTHNAFIGPVKVDVSSFGINVSNGNWYSILVLSILLLILII